MTDSSRPHLLLVNLGTPTAPTPEAVREFLAEFLSDPAVVDLPRLFWRPILHGIVLRTRPRRVAEQYASIWTTEGSPLRVATERMARGVEAMVGGRAGVSVAYRYGAPSIPTEIERLARQPGGPVIVVPLFPHRTDATTGTAFRQARDAAERAGLGSRFRPRLIPPDDAGYIEALAARWREALATVPSPPEHLVVSYHGIPVRYNRRERGSYTADCDTTTRALLAAIGWPADRTTLAFQSRFGPERWLTPATADVLETLPARGVRHAAIIAPGFLTEGLETLEELCVRGAESFRHAGGERLTWVSAVEDHPAMLRSLVSLATGDDPGGP